MKYVYAFEEGNQDQKYLLGRQGSEPRGDDEPRPPGTPGFTITTEACKVYMAGHDTMPEGLMDEVTGDSVPSSRRWARPSVTPTTRCWCRSARVRRSPCPG